MAKARMFKWTVEVEVSENWVADGFDLSNRIEELGETLLPFSVDGEVAVHIRKAPDPDAIRKAQGY